jgi:HSP20 family protein
MDKFVGDYSGLQSLKTKRGYPKVDVYRQDDDLVFEAAVPGMKKEDLSIELEENILTIRGESQAKLVELSEEDKDKKVLHAPYIKELKRSSFVRRFTLPVYLDVGNMDKVDATLEDGILYLTFKDAYVKETLKTNVTDIPIK